MELVESAAGMASAQFADDELRKAAHNADRIRVFFGERTMWTLSPEGRQALEKVLTALRSNVEIIEGLFARLGIDVATEPAEADVVLPGGELDAPRLRAFAGFLEQFHGWLCGQSHGAISSEGAQLMSSIHRSLAATGEAVTAILEADQVTSAPQPVAVTPEPAFQQAPRPVHAKRPAAPAMQSNDSRLVLQDTDETPVLQELRGQIELTPQAKDALSTFLATHGIELDSYKRRKLETNILRWIHATPEGQILVLKISALHGAPEPYPTYRPLPEGWGETDQ
jgi:hypothetical protein